MVKPLISFPQPLVRGRLISRYKRFFADVELETGETITAHVANPGAMLTLKDPGNLVWLSTNDDPKRKLKFSWELVELSGHYVGVNTSWPNLLGERAIKAGLIPELSGYDTLRREVKYDENSRIDILLTQEGRKDCYVEIKNVNWSRAPGLVEFPDCVTTRGAKHLEALTRMTQQGHRAVMLFVIQRNDCKRFDTGDDIDKIYGPALRDAARAGVEVIVQAFAPSPSGFEFGERLDWQSAPKL